MDSHYWDIAAKQLNGKATPAEQEELRRWRSTDPEHEAQYQAQQQVWQSTAPARTAEVDTDAAWRKVRNRLSSREQKQETKVIPMYSRLLRVAAAVTLLIGMAWLVQYLFFPYMGMQVVESADRKVSVMLPDSSEVWLNKGSKLAYDKDFDGDTRAVVLEGEAFFEVKRNPQRPFVIQAKGTQTTVLGTSFNLRAYTSEDAVELAVATGKVTFASSKGKAEKLVTAGHAARLGSQTAGIVLLPLQDGNTWSWKSGRLVFNATPLQQVLQDLERHYGVAFQLRNDDLAKCRFTASFQDPELEVLLQVLAATLQLDYQTQDNLTYTLTGSGCNK